MVNELLIQLQSFDTPPASVRHPGCLRRHGQSVAADRAGGFGSRPRPRPTSWSSGPPTGPATSTRRCSGPAASTGTITVDLPSRAGRREILDYYLARKAHARRTERPGRPRDAGRFDVRVFAGDARAPARRGAGVGPAPGCRPAQLGRHPAGEDDRGARTGPAGRPTPRANARTIATHEAGHATVAWLVAPERSLEVLSIIKRSSALGLLAHSEPEERWTRTRSEIEALIRIAMGGLVAEEIFFGETSSGVSGDLLAATEAAAQMVGSFGMAGSLISLDAVEGRRCQHRGQGSDRRDLPGEGRVHSGSRPVTMSVDPQRARLPGGGASRRPARARGADRSRHRRRSRTALSRRGRPGWCDLREESPAEAPGIRPGPTCLRMKAWTRASSRQAS